MVVVHDGGDTQLIEVAAHDELQLQNRLKQSPDLLPVDELGLREPLMVVGRETTLASGSVDLLAVTPDGELLVIEFKTGPQNPDFRAALAQLLDYGSDMWKMTVDEFEAGVAVRYFLGNHCPSNAPTKGATTLQAAASATWPDMAPADIGAFIDKLTDALQRGSFHYVVVAQRFTDPMQATVQYLNEIASPARFYLVEVVRFAGGGLDAFEARTILRPTTKRAQTPASLASETAFLVAVEDEEYRQACERLFDLSRALGLRFEWGAKGTSIRLPVPDKTQPVSIAWAFPPNVTGWMGLTNLTFGFDATLAASPETLNALQTYVDGLAAIPGAQNVTKATLNARAFPPATYVTNETAISDRIAHLVANISGDIPHS
jgi:hypothetical protein